MGGTEAYVCYLTLKWFAGRVYFASSLPLLQKNTTQRQKILKLTLIVLIKFNNVMLTGCVKHR